MVPICKKGDIDDPSNYRLISLLNSTYKIFASLVRGRIQKAVDNKLSETQYLGNQRTLRILYVDYRTGQSKREQNFIWLLSTGRKLLIGATL